MRVSFHPDFYINRLIPQSNWEGVIVRVRTSDVGERTKYFVQLDEQFQAEALEKEVDVFEEEMNRNRCFTQ
jgi:predicted RNA-binding protein with PIN domain